MSLSPRKAGTRVHRKILFNTEKLEHESIGKFCPIPKSWNTSGTRVHRKLLFNTEKPQETSVQYRKAGTRVHRKLLSNTEKLEHESTGNFCSIPKSWNTSPQETSVQYRKAGTWVHRKHLSNTEYSFQVHRFSCGNT